MADARRSVESILQEKQREISDFGNAVEELFAETAREVRREFLRELDGMLAGDLKRFQRRVAESLAQAGMDLLAPHLEDSLRRIGGDALGASLGRVARDADVGTFIPGQPAPPRGGLNLETTLSRMVFSAVSGALWRVRTGSRSSESERSREAERQFRASRGQAQAQVAQEIARGQRNL